MKKDYKELYEKITESDWFKKAYHNKSLGECPIVVEGLEESEDERIRKYLISIVNARTSTDFESFGWDKAKIIAYLEKQEEHQKFRDAIQEGDKVTRNQTGELVNLSQLERVAKPAEWDDKDLPQGGESIMINRILHSLKLYREMLKNSNFEEDYIKTTLNDCLEDEKWLTSLETSQKPAEWSVEDKLNLQSCIGKIEIDMQHWGNHGKTMVDGDIRLIDWLKNLPERFELQPKQEWSYEDENRFRNLIFLVEQSEEGGATKEAFISFIKRLKSLRPQSHWKPSEEQMEALWNTLHPDDPYYVDLSSLYDNLKKL